MSRDLYSEIIFNIIGLAY